MDIILYKEDLIPDLQGIRGEFVRPFDFRTDCLEAIVFANKVTFMDGAVPFVIKDRGYNE